MEKTTLLIIDDEQILLESVAEMLSGVADNILMCNDPIKAVELLMKEKVHCVVCDINMPGLNGVQVIKKIRTLKNEVPFIFYTGHGNQTLMLEVAKYGAFDFIDKPNLEGLEHAVVQGIKTGLKLGTKRPGDDTNLRDYTSLLAKLNGGNSDEK